MNNIMDISRDELLLKLQGNLSEKRYNHVLRVETKAIQLATRWGISLEKASIAALLHDYAKEVSDEIFLQIIDNKKMDPELKKWNNGIWHGVVGAEIVKDDLNIYDEDILNSIREHTIGNIYMCKLSQIIYIADYIEDGRDFPGVELVRELSFEDLSKSIYLKSKQLIRHLSEQDKKIYPDTVITYNNWRN